MLDLGALKLSIVVDSNEAKSELDSVQEKASGTSNSLGTKLASAGKVAAAGIAAIGTAAAAGGAAIYKVATSSAETADRIDKMSQKIGVSRTAFQEWDYICSQSGVDVGVLQSGVKTLTTQMDNAAGGSASAQEAFQALGLTWEDGNGKLKNQETMMEEAILALAGMEDGTERARLAQELFGKAGTELAPILNSGAEGVEALRQRCHDLGLVMSDEAVASGVLMGDTIADVKASFAAVTTQIGAQFMPVIQQIADYILANMPTIQSVIQVVFDACGSLIQALIPVIQSLMGAISEMVTSAQTEGTLFNTIWTTIQTVFSSVITIITDLLKAASAIMQGDWETLWNSILNIANTIWETIKAAFSAFLDILVSLLIGIWDAMKQAAKGLFEKVQEGFTEIWNKIKTWVSSSFTSLVSIVANFGSSLFNAGKNLFTNLWNGIKSIWSSIQSWVSEKVSWLTGQLSFWNNGKKQINGSHRTGLREVPFDGYIAELHKGEMVLTSSEAARYRNSQNVTEKTATTTNTINFNGTYSFRDTNDIDYFMNEAGKLLRRKVS